MGDGIYDSEYLNSITEVQQRIDNERGNGDGKLQVNEFLDSLDIPFLLSGQSKEDEAKLRKLTANIPEILAKYAGDDGVLSAQEHAEFLNGAEWSAVMDAWHASTKKAEMELRWIDEAHNQDGLTKRDELRTGLLQNLQAEGIDDIDAASIDKLIRKYAGKDNTFTVEEYQKLKQDPEYKALLGKYGITPWFVEFKKWEQDNSLSEGLKVLLEKEDMGL